MITRVLRARVRAGFSLVECVLALVLLGLGLAGVAATTTAGLRTAREASLDAEAVDLGRLALDSLALHETPASGSVRRDALLVLWSVTPVARGWQIDVTVRDAAGRDRFLAGTRAAPWPRTIPVLP